MKVKVKFHSSYKKYFDDDSYDVDIATYSDILFYLKGMHPRFANYIHQIENGDINEYIGLVDSKFNCISSDIQNVKRPKDGEVVYISPVIAGAGGKMGGIIMGIALIAVAIAVPYALGAAHIAAMAPGAMGGFTGGFMGTMSVGFSVMGSMMSSLMVQIGMMGLNMLMGAFTKKPKNPVQGSPDSAARTENNMFCALSNTTESGTPVSLHYGMTRVAGQFVSGYLHTSRHGKGKDPSVQTLFNAGHTPNAIVNKEAA